MKRSLRLVMAGVLVAGLGCAGTPATTTRSTLPVETAALLDHAEINRVFVSELTRLATDADPLVRARLARVLGHLGDEAGRPLLAPLVDDADDSVARAALFSLGLLGAGEEREALVSRLLSQLDARERPTLAAARLDAVARLGAAGDAPRLVALAASPEAAVRAGALRALGLFGQRGLELPDPVVEAIANALGDPDEPVRFMATFALYRVAKPLPGPEAARAALRRATTTDPSAEVRAHAAKALARRGGLDEPTLAKLLDDSSAVVTGTTMLALDLLPAESRCATVATALDHLAKRLVADPDLAVDDRVHALVTGLESAANCPAEGRLVPIAGRILDTTREITGNRTAGVARAACLAAFVAGAEELALVACDPARPWSGKRLAIRRLAARAATDAAAAKTIADMIGEPDLRVALSALEALDGLGTPEAAARVLAGLADERLLVVSLAADLVGAHPERYRDGTGTKVRPEVLAALGAVVDRFLGFDHAHAPVLSAVDALAALADPAARPIVEKVAADPRPLVRRRALVARGALPDLPPFDATALPAPRPARSPSSERLSAVRASTPVLVLATSRGIVKARLAASLAPVNVDALVEQAGAGSLDGTEIHRVVPGFVVQLGDPTGTGAGDPGYTLPCEVSETPYVRGVVGMALSGKDTGGSQFFFTLTRQPHLDAGYTVVGEVVEGLEVLDLIEQGDTIESARVE